MTIPRSPERARRSALIASLTGALLAVDAAMCAPPVVTMERGTEVTWTSVEGKTYRPQWSSVDSGTWNDLAPAVDGNGETLVVLDQSADGRLYQVLQTTPGEQPFEDAVRNGSFEEAGGWTFNSAVVSRVSGGSFVGDFSLKIEIGPQFGTEVASSATVTEAPAVSPGAIYEFSFRAKQSSTHFANVQQYQVQWLGSNGAVVSSTGWVPFSGGEGGWAVAENTSLTAPSNAAAARVLFYFATGAFGDASLSVALDDISLVTAASSGPTEDETVAIPFEQNKVAAFSWVTESGETYTPEYVADLHGASWTPMGSVSGDGGTKSVVVPASGSSLFFRLVYSDDVAPPPSLGDIVPLFDANTIKESDLQVDTQDALITYNAQRARVRHAREFEFSLYEKYKDFYFEQRFSGLKIIDEVAKGGSRIIFQLTTLDRLSSAEMRFFHLQKNVYALNMSDFAGQTSVKLISTTPSVRFPGETEYIYEAIVDRHALLNRNLQTGDVIEFEHSLFLSNPRNGSQKNYYGTTFLYVVGEGLVPWYAPALESGIGTGDTSAELPAIAWMGGTTTLHTDYSDGATEQFKQMSSVLSMENANDFLLGRRLHHTDWGSGEHSEPNNPAMLIHRGKLGPSYNTASCVSCHDKNGVSVLPAVGQPLINHVVMIGRDAEGNPHPRWGEQLSPRAISGDPEGQVLLQGYETIAGSYGDGSPYTLRRPRYEFVGEESPEFYSVRAAQKLVALGLREAVPEESILALADPDDLDGDGISGRVPIVTDPNDPSKKLMGRFGRKGSQPSVQHQIAYAFNRDMGVATDLMPVLDGATTSSPTEVSVTELGILTKYIQLLGTPPARQTADAQVIRGRQLFAQISCSACHTPEMTTGPNHPLAALRNQLFRPYSDGLLHDMGPGLADNMDGETATAAEWLTAPLVGTGLVEAAAGEESYLHDGRARTIEDAILWHGGEAEQAKERFRTMPATDREAILKFIRSL
jgi:CxxC motif-containing protein (DUF1111 family)